MSADATFEAEVENTVRILKAIRSGNHKVALTPAPPLRPNLVVIKGGMN